MPWSGGVYTRGYPSWSNDAASNLPISSSKFDIEDNDFAGGLNNCLTRDGLTSPTATINWSQTASVVMNQSRGSDGTISTFSRTGGSNNPQLQIVNADGTGMSLNLSTSQQLSLSIAGTAVLALTPTVATLNPTTSVAISPGTSGALNVGAVAILAWTATQVALFGSAVAATAQLNISNTSTVATQDARANINAGSSGWSVYVANQSRATAVVTNGPTAAQVALFTTAAIPLVFGINSVYAGQINANGAWQIPAPTSGVGLTVAGASGATALTLNANGTGANSFGLTCNGGTTSGDWCAIFRDNGGVNLMEIRGDRAVLITDNAAAPALFQVGYMDAPQNLQASTYGFLLSDRGKSIYRANAAAVTWTIPANGTTAFPIGTVITLINDATSGVLTIAITTDTLVWVPSLTGGAGTSRALAAGAVATLIKVAATRWLISGVGIS